MRTQYVTWMLDPGGMPRAWGVADTKEAATEEARRQLDLYRARKREVGDPLADAEFTEKHSVQRVRR